MEARCLNCGLRIAVEPGHRPRQYCNANCRQAAYRKRLDRPKRTTFFQGMRELEQRWPDLRWETVYFLQVMRRRMSMMTLEWFVKIIRQEKEQSSRTDV